MRREHVRDLVRASVVSGAAGVALLLRPYRRIQRYRRAHTPPCVLLLRPDHLGDVLLTTPAIAALRAALPNSDLIALVGPWAAEALDGAPQIDGVHVVRFPGFTRAPAAAPWAPYIQLLREARRIARWHVDAAINFRPDFWWGAALLALAGIPIRVGYDLAPGGPALTHRVAYPSTPEHATRSAIRLAAATATALGVSNFAFAPSRPEAYPLVFALTDDEHAWARAWLERAGLHADAHPIFIHPGAGAAVKRWTVQGWARAIEALAERTGTPVIVGGTSAEADLVAAIARAVRPPASVVAFTEDVPLIRYAALLTSARLVLGVDSGPLHLATAVGTPTVRLFGPTDPVVFGPWGPPEHHAVVRGDALPCIPCGRLDYTPDELPAHPCVPLIHPEAVVEAALQVLGCADTAARAASGGKTA